jgi:hypothetical protein
VADQEDKVIGRNGAHSAASCQSGAARKLYNC